MHPPKVAAVESACPRTTDRGMEADGWRSRVSSRDEVKAKVQMTVRQVRAHNSR